MAFPAPPPASLPSCSGSPRRDEKRLRDSPPEKTPPCFTSFSFPPINIGGTEPPSEFHFSHTWDKATHKIPPVTYRGQSHLQDPPIYWGQSHPRNPPCEVGGKARAARQGGASYCSHFIQPLRQLMSTEQQPSGNLPSPSVNDPLQYSMLQPSACYDTWTGLCSLDLAATREMTEVDTVWQFTGGNLTGGMTVCTTSHANKRRTAS
jgi:hypothetical protein